MFAKNKQETTLLIILALATLAGIALFVVKLWLPEKFDKKPAEKNAALEENTTEDSRVPSITIEKLKNKIDAGQDLIILDVQTRENNNQASIPMALSIPLAELSDRTNELPKNKEIIVVDSGEGCESCQRGAEILLDSGFTDIKKLDGGVTGWADAGYPITMGQDVTFKNVNAKGLQNKREAGEEIIILDVREQEEYQQGHIPAAVYVPFAGITKNINAYPKDKEIIIYDKVGNRSEIATKQFVREGYTNVLNLVGGINQWQAEGYEIEK